MIQTSSDIPRGFFATEYDEEDEAYSVDVQEVPIAMLFHKAFGEANSPNENVLKSHSFFLIKRACNEENWNLISQYKDQIFKCMNQEEESVIMRFLRMNKLEVIEKIIKQNLYTTLVGQDSHRVFREIVIRGHYSLAKEFFNAGELFLVNAIDSRGANALISAIEGEQKEFAKICLQNGNYPNQYFHYYNFRLNSLSFAVYQGAIECLDQLVETLQQMKRLNKIDFSETTEHVGNLLHLAIWANQPGMLHHLLTKYHKQTLSLIEREDPEGKTPLMLAASLGDVQSIKILLDANAMIEAKDCSGRTAMHYAAEKNHINAILFLIKEGADENVQDSCNQAPSQCCDKVTERLLLNIKLRKQIEELLPTDYMALVPYNCIFQGGGAKGLVYLGVTRALEKLNLLEGIRRFAGTSAGALTALFLALGMGSTELEETLKNTSVMKLLNLFIFVVSEDEKPRMNEYCAFLKNAGISIAKMGIALLKSLSIVAGKKTGWTSGKKLRNWLNTLIETYTEIPNCTFGELSDLIKAGKPFKHLHVMTTDLKTSSVLHINSEDKKWKNFLIADAVVASAAYPLLVALQTLREKIDGVLVTNTNYQCSDGGILFNLPAEIFDRVEQPGWMDPQLAIPQFNRRSIAFCFERSKLAPSKDKESVYNFLASVLTKIYMRSENITRQVLSGRHEERLVRLSTGGITTTEFQTQVSDEKAAKALKESYKATKVFFKNRKRNFDSFLKQSETSSK
ncbi:patatin-like phospholipase family protein [Parachlamydia sp.]|uniref:patatin-like phospholipase family protein n=1 Tax=Parachlamydia sp. TaxID=2052048 RepID=UPI003D0F931D